MRLSIAKRSRLNKWNDDIKRMVLLIFWHINLISYGDSKLELITFLKTFAEFFGVPSLMRHFVVKNNFPIQSYNFVSESKQLNTRDLNWMIYVLL